MTHALERVGAGGVEELLARRTAANERFFAAEADRIARLCHGMAERFARGGRLHRDRRLAAGALRRPPRRGRVRSPGDRRQAGAARDRARASRAGRSSCRSELVARAGRHRDRLRGRARNRGRARTRRARGCLTIAFAHVGAEWEFEPPSDDPFVRQELVETLYHVLWELVHVFFEHRGLLEGRAAEPVHDGGASSFLYPFLGRGGGRARVGARATSPRP